MQPVIWLDHTFLVQQVEIELSLGFKNAHRKLMRWANHLSVYDESLGAVSIFLQSQRAPTSFNAIPKRGHTFTFIVHCQRNEPSLKCHVTHL